MRLKSFTGTASPHSLTRAIHRPFLPLGTEVQPRRPSFTLTAPLTSCTPAPLADLTHPLGLSFNVTSQENSPQRALSDALIPRGILPS